MLFEHTKPRRSTGCMWVLLAGFVGMLAGLYQLAQALA